MQFFFRRRPDVAQEVETLVNYGVEPQVRQQLADFLGNAPAREVCRTNPRLVADRLKLNERETLRLLVRALSAGLVTLNWEMKCPACGSCDGSIHSLEHIETVHTCPMCRFNYETDADDNVRVTFTVDESIRPLDDSADDPVFRGEIDVRYGAVSGHRLLTLQTFRDLFPNQSLPPTESMQIRRVAILFTDLAGSTALYVRRGDPRAFELVRQHFDRLFATVDEHGGVVLKTIGDAIMSAFIVPADAVRAALAMHRAIIQLNTTLRLDPPDQLVLKVGVHIGPCISVNLNGRLDYFGTTVNAAARVQGTSKGNDIAMSEAVAHDEDVARLMSSLKYERSELVLRGFDDPITIYHLGAAVPVTIED